MFTTMPWGMHRGKPLSEIDENYLRWVAYEASATKPWLKHAIIEELDRRNRRVDRICADAAALAATFQPDGLVLEATAFQELMAPPLRAALEAAGARTMIYPEEDVTPRPCASGG
jgi:hypothetical protein